MHWSLFNLNVELFQDRMRMLPVIRYIESHAKFDKGKVQTKSVIEVYEASLDLYNICMREVHTLQLCNVTYFHMLQVYLK